MKKTALAFLLIVALLIPSLANAQITSHYGRKEGVNPAAFTLTIFSPNDQTAYADTMLLNFNITWTTFVSFPFPQAPQLKADYAYSIDDGPLIPIKANQSASDLFYGPPEGNFTINPYFSYLVNVSDLVNGYHKIALVVGLYRHSDYYYINQSCIPTTFLVQNSIPTPTQVPSPIPSPSIEHTPPQTTTITPSIAQSNSPTHFPTLTPGGMLTQIENERIRNQMLMEFIYTLIAVIATIAVIVGIVAYFYFKKRRKNNEKTAI